MKARKLEVVVNFQVGGANKKKKILLTADNVNLGSLRNVFAPFVNTTCRQDFTCFCKLALLTLLKTTPLHS